MAEEQKAVGKKRGRKTKKTPERTAKALELAEQGMTEPEIAEIIGVSPSSITYWKKTDIQFAMALKEHKKIADNLVEASLFKRAMGYKLEDGKELPPDTTAMIFWLKNRQPEQWRERPDPQNPVMVNLVLNTGEKKYKFDL